MNTATICKARHALLGHSSQGKHVMQLEATKLGSDRNGALLQASKPVTAKHCCQVIDTTTLRLAPDRAKHSRPAELQ